MIHLIPAVLSRTVMVCALLFAGHLTVTAAHAQAAKKDKKPPETVSLNTSDGVKLDCTYFPGSNGKETIPIILLHRWDSNRESMLDLGGYLQRSGGHAVIVPDLRGHGTSLEVVDRDEKLEKDRWRAEQIAQMVEDIEACKKFLIEKNNAGDLNIDMLTIAAEGESCIHAIAWTLRDWSYGDLGGIKQGRDVKALVLMDPERAFKGLNVTEGLKHPLFTGRHAEPLPIFITANSKQTRVARSIRDSLSRGRKSRGAKDDELDYASYKIEKRQRVVGSKRDKRLLNQEIADFVMERVNSKKHEFRWQDRSRD